ncbi:3-deoxy-manno-octulosonate cytidylyltransferase [Polaribacter sp. MED152]|uniref:3-deoxy-manno-octulosonate cytidylyltransferase n=1 Tax=Polaribacter sp. MED152 TaxID=313598 RepID=UPI000068CB35|nr:3-deoxy-manno-octulosonate cytidylyltransferase [Polaribacter sp. MED152]EAQ42174.1 3-deoxy-D-manno-octulosonatecytidylyltransferase [Polaribacter sp. MED152]
MKIVGVIPARYQSSRFPGKPLVDLNGVPMIIRVANIVEKCLGKDNTYVATDDNRIKEVVEFHGFKAIMTSSDCLTGTDRVYDFSKQIKADIYVNVQGDEPLLNHKDIQKIINTKKINMKSVINGMCSLTSDENPHNVNIPKVVTNKFNDLLYMSRLAVPGIKNFKNNVQPDYKKQVCIYAFSQEELQAYGSQKEKSVFEGFEDIEILRFFDLNIPIKMVETSGSSLAVDILEDVAKVEAVLINIEGKLRV